MDTNQGSVSKNFINGRALSYLISYVVASWTIVQFTDWLVSRYAYSAAWVDLLLFGLILLIPGVIVFALAFGAERLKKSICYWAIPVNVVLALAVLFFAFRGVAFGSTAKKITVVDEEGQTIERMMPTAAFTKRLVFFPADQQNPTEDNLWLSFAIPHLQMLDLEQNKRFYNFSPLSLKDNFKDYNYEITDKLPFAVKRKIAEDRFTDFFVTTEILQDKEPVRVNFKVHNTTNGELFTEHTYEGQNLFAVVDEFSREVEDEIFSKELNVKEEQVIDLPVADLLSANEDALKEYILAFMGSKFNNNSSESIAHYEKAITLDPDFASAYANLGMMQYSIGKPAEGELALDKAINLIEPLPERQKFSIKSNSYLFKNELEKAIRLLEMWRSLYPNDYSPYDQLFNIYTLTANFTKAEEVGLAALENGHAGPMYEKLAGLYSQKGEYEKAIQYYELYEQAFPAKAKNSTDRGDLYFRMGEYDKAKTFFEELSLLNTNDYENYVYLGSIAAKQGDAKEEMKMYNKALRIAKTAKDSIAVYKNLEVAFDRVGKLRKSIETMNTRWALTNKNYPPVLAASDLFRFDVIGRYASIGQDEIILNKIEEATPLFSNAQFDIRCAAMVNYYCVKEDGDKLAETMEACPEAVQQGSIGAMLNYLNGILEKSKGNYKEAIPHFLKFSETSGAEEFFISMQLYDSYRLNGEFDKAIEGMTSLVEKYPDVPAIIYFKAMALRDGNKKKEALETANIALEILKEADPDYDLLIKLQQLAKELS